MVERSELDDIESVGEKLIIEENIRQNDVESDDEKGTDIDIDVVPSVEFMADL